MKNFNKNSTKIIFKSLFYLLISLFFIFPSFANKELKLKMNSNIPKMEFTKRDTASTFKKIKFKKKNLLSEALKENQKNEDMNSPLTLNEIVSDTKELKEEIHRDLAKSQNLWKLKIQTKDSANKKINFGDVELKISDREEEAI